MDEIVKNLINNHYSELSEGVRILKNDRLNEAETKYITTKEEMKQNPTYKKIEQLCKSHGYVLIVAYQQDYGDGDLVPRVEIRDNDRYSGEIYLQDDMAKKDYYFTAQTTSYGPLNLEEYDKFLTSCNDTRDLLKGLNDIDLSGLGIVAEN